MGAVTGTLGLPSAVGGLSAAREDLSGDARLSPEEEVQLR